MTTGCRRHSINARCLSPPPATSILPDFKLHFRFSSYTLFLRHPCAQLVMAVAKATAGPRYTAPQAVHYSAPGSSTQRECEWLAGAGPAQCPPPRLANISHSPWGTCLGLCSFAEHSQASWTPVSPTTEALDVSLCELHKNECIFELVISQ